MGASLFSAWALVASMQAVLTDSSQIQIVAREAWVMGTRLAVAVDAPRVAVQGAVGKATPGREALERCPD